MSFLINSFKFGIPWTPAQITKAAWYDASDSSTITSSGGAVSKWDDKSGNTRHLTQATGAMQPSNTLTVNSRTVLDFNGTTSNMTSDAFSADCKSVIVCLVNDLTITNATTGRNIINTKLSLNSNPFCSLGFGMTTGSLTNEVISVLDDDLNTFTDRQGISSAVIPSIAAGSTSIVAISLGASNWFMGFNGSDDLRDLTAGTRNPLDFTQGIKVGCATTGGGDVGHFDGKIAELIIGVDEWSAADRKKLEGYLAWKWGISSDLPTSHPYKYGPPYI